MKEESWGLFEQVPAGESCPWAPVRRTETGDEVGLMQGPVNQ